jgi:putative endonuclease
MKRPCVYILAAKRNGTLYVGVTSEILRRGWEHKSGAVSGFTKIYGIHLLVHVEFYGTMPEDMR